MQRFLLGLGSSAFKILLLLTATVMAIVIVLGNPKPLKTSLSESKVYDALVDNAIKSMESPNKPQEGQEDGISLSQPEVKQAVQNAFTPALLQGSTEQIIDGVYRWLDGKTPQPDFKIDLTNAKATLAANLSEYAVRRFNSLPACTTQQLRELNTDIDPLNVPCQVSGVSSTQISQKLNEEILNNKDFLPNPVITADNLPKNDQGKTSFEQLDQLPKAFKLGKSSGLILAVLTVLLGLALVFLRHNKRRGIRTVAVSLLGVGIFLALTTLLVIFLFSKATQPNGQITNSLGDNAFNASVVSIVKALSNALNRVLLQLAVLYVGLGAIMLIGLRFIRPKAAEVPATPSSSTDTNPEAQNTEEKPTE
jgi:hypothetical protein